MEILGDSMDGRGSEYDSCHFEEERMETLAERTKFEKLRFQVSYEHQRWCPAFV